MRTSLNGTEPVWDREEKIIRATQKKMMSQPVTRTEIERIRGVSSDYAVNRLIEYGLIEEAGRLDAPGRPILFRPTDEFYRRFGVSGKEELPKTDASVDARIEDEVRQELTEYDLSAGKEKD